MIYTLNDETHLTLDRETMIHVAAAVRVFLPRTLGRTRVELENFCAMLECLIEREPEPNMDLIS